MALESQPAGSLFATRSHPKYNEEAFDAEIAAVFESNVFDAEVRGDIHFSDRASITVLAALDGWMLLRVWSQPTMVWILTRG